MNGRGLPWPRRWRVLRTLRGKLIAGLVALLAIACATVGVVTYFAVQRSLSGELSNQLQSATSDVNNCLDFMLGDAQAAAQRRRAELPETIRTCECGAPAERSWPIYNGLGRWTASRRVPAANHGSPLSRRGQAGAGGHHAVAPAQHGPVRQLHPAPRIARTAPTRSPLSTIPTGPMSPACRWPACTTRSGTWRWSRPRSSAGSCCWPGCSARCGSGCRCARCAGWRPPRPRSPELPLESGEVELPAGVPDTDPDTETGQVGLAFNRMLGHVQAALTRRAASETRLRRFAADASHELRTPLAAIRGYAELGLLHPGDSPEAVTHALGRVLSESTRMSVLVDDLLLLARLDAGPAAEPRAGRHDPAGHRRDQRLAGRQARPPLDARTAR